LVDEITEPPCLVLRYLDDDALHVSTSKRLAKSDIKFIARNILEVLSESVKLVTYIQVTF
jgi:hypothetical protein